jgi:hypothetical protein
MHAIGIRNYQEKKNLVPSFQPLLVAIRSHQGAGGVLGAQTLRSSCCYRLSNPSKQTARGQQASYHPRAKHDQLREIE